MNLKNALAIPELNRKRTEDFTIEELRQLDCFQSYSNEQLTQLLETIKVYTRSILQSHRKEKGQRKIVKLSPSLNPTKKAA